MRDLIETQGMKHKSLGTIVLFLNIILLFRWDRLTFMPSVRKVWQKSVKIYSLYNLPLLCHILLYSLWPHMSVQCDNSILTSQQC